MFDHTGEYLLFLKTDLFTSSMINFLIKKMLSKKEANSKDYLKTLEIYNYTCLLIFQIIITSSGHFLFSVFLRNPENAKTWCCQVFSLYVYR